MRNNLAYTRNNDLITLNAQWFKADNCNLSTSLSQSSKNPVPDYYVFFAINPKQDSDEFSDQSGMLNNPVIFRLEPSQCFAICETISLISDGRVSETESFEIKTDPTISAYKSQLKSLRLNKDYDDNNKVTRVILNIAVDGKPFTCSIDLPTALSIKDVLQEYVKKAIDLNVSARVVQ